MTAFLRPWTLLVLCIATSCTSSVAFQETDYEIDVVPIEASAIVVIPEESATKKVRIRSFSAGIANKWDAEAGVMLQQAAQIELSQLFGAVEFLAPGAEPTLTGDAARVHLSLDEYEFEDFVAKVRVHAVVEDAAGAGVLDEVYGAEGVRQQGKLLGGGAFGMKSAIRQSSLAAYQVIFAALRSDLGDAFGVPQPVAAQR
jgi:hypothetical protein